MAHPMPSQSRSVQGWPTTPASEAARAPGGGLTVNIRRRCTTVVVSLGGTLDELAARRLARTLGDLIDGQGNLAVAVDLGQVHGVDPTGMQVLSAAASNLERRGGALSLEGVVDAGALTRPVEAGFDRTDAGDTGGPTAGWPPTTRPAYGRPRAGHPAGRGPHGNRQGARR